MRAVRLFVIAWTFVASACGGAAATSPGPDGGSTPAAPTTSTNADSASCMIVASNYDQSCMFDTDCVLVTPGDYCGGGPCLCETEDTATIRRTALAQFNADVANTPVGSGAATTTGACNGCPGGAQEPCCRQGTCQIGSKCTSPTDTLPECADAGGTCIYVGGCKVGPPNSCAYDDENCCLPPPSPSPPAH